MITSINKIDYDNIFCQFGISVVRLLNRKKGRMDKELKAEVIKGCDLTVEQKSMINFRGMNNSEWVKNHSFNFIDGKPADKDSGLYYPICHSFSHLPN